MNLASAIDAMPRLAPADLRTACHALMSEWLGECSDSRVRRYPPLGLA